MIVPKAPEGYEWGPFGGSRRPDGSYAASISLIAARFEDFARLGSHSGYWVGDNPLTALEAAMRNAIEAADVATATRL